MFRRPRILVACLLAAGCGLAVAIHWLGVLQVRYAEPPQPSIRSEPAQDRRPSGPRTARTPVNPRPIRWIELDGVKNARDIGGYPTADGRSVCWNLVYRSGNLSELTDAGCEQFRNLGIRRLIDFRNRMGVSPLFGGDAPCVFEAAEMTLLAVHGVPDQADRVTYVQLLHHNTEPFRQALELLADPDNLPVLYHCTAGKDRTGMMTVLLLSLLGVDRALVMEDYQLSAAVAGSSPERVEELFDDIDQQGGIGSYLAGLGVTPGEQEAIRANLLE